MKMKNGKGEILEGDCLKTSDNIENKEIKEPVKEYTDCHCCDHSIKNSKDVKDDEDWLWLLVLGIILVLVGFALCLASAFGVWYLLVSGVILIISGVPAIVFGGRHR